MMQPSASAVQRLMPPLLGCRPISSGPPNGTGVGGPSSGSAKAVMTFRRDQPQPSGQPPHAFASASPFRRGGWRSEPQQLADLPLLSLPDCHPLVGDRGGEPGNPRQIEGGCSLRGDVQRSDQPPKLRELAFIDRPPRHRQAARRLVAAWLVPILSSRAAVDFERLPFRHGRRRDALAQAAASRQPIRSERAGGATKITPV